METRHSSSKQAQNENDARTISHFEFAGTGMGPLGLLISINSVF
jgi:hypothetical protein